MRRNKNFETYGFRLFEFFIVFCAFSFTPFLSFCCSDQHPTGACFQLKKFWESISLNNSKKLNGLDCYYKGILFEIDRIQEGAKNSKHASHATNYITTLWLLHIFAFESAIQSLFEFFASIHLLVFGCLFLVGQGLDSWVLSKRLANKPAWSSSRSVVLLHIFNDIINFRVFWVKIHFRIRRSRRHCY